MEGIDIPAWFAEWGHDLSHDAGFGGVSKYLLIMNSIFKEVSYELYRYFSYYPQISNSLLWSWPIKVSLFWELVRSLYDQLDQPLKDSLTEYFRVENLNLDEVKRLSPFF